MNTCDDIDEVSGTQDGFTGSSLSHTLLTSASRCPLSRAGKVTGYPGLSRNPGGSQDGNFFFKRFYLFLRQGETEHEQGRVRERETQNLKQAPGSELSAQSPTRGSNSRTARS